MFSDHSIGELDDDELVGAMAAIKEAQEFSNKEKVTVDKTSLKDAKRLPKSTEEEKALRKEAIRYTKNSINEAKQANLAIERAPIILDDLNKFNTEAGILRIAAADRIVEGDILTVFENVDEELCQARALPKNTKAEKEIRADAIKLAKAKREANALIKKYGKENIREPLAEEKQAILDKETPNFIAALAVKRELSQYAKKESVYRRATKPFRESESLIKESEYYRHFEELEARYNELIAKRA